MSNDSVLYAKSGARIKERREALGLTLEEVGKALGVNKSTIKRYEDGITKRITIATYERLAKILDTTPLYLMGGDEEKTVNAKQTLDKLSNIESFVKSNAKKLNERIRTIGIMHPIPILGEIKAGDPNFINQEPLGYTYIDKNDYENYFALKVKGDSMDLVNIKEGSVVVVHRQNYIENGEIGVVIIDNECATVKKVYVDGDIATLIPQSSNPSNQPINIDLKRRSLEILGKVIKVEYYI